MYTVVQRKKLFYIEFCGEEKGNGKSLVVFGTVLGNRLNFSALVKTKFCYPILISKVF